MRYLYSAVLYLLLPALLLRLLWRSRREPEYCRRLSERFGCVPFSASSAPLIWIHAVSVGETLAAGPLVEALLERYPDHRIAVTTTTPTGSARVRARFGGRVLHAYAPWDLPGSVTRFLRRARPRLLVLMETELWPNTIHHCRLSGCRVLLANARLSARSARGYARLAALARPMLEELDRVACQSREDARRFLALGLPREALELTGSIKFDIVPGPAERDQALELRDHYRTAERPLLLAASTHPGEDELVLEAFARVRARIPDCLLVLAPRHTGRCAAVRSLCTARGWRVRSRSDGGALPADLDIELVDTMGELALLQSVATVVLVGGSLAPLGGHNPLEAAAWGVPLVCGPHMFNFSDITRQLIDAGAMLQLEPGDLACRLLELLQDDAARQRMGRAGSRVFTAGAGALQRLLALVAELEEPPAAP